MNEYVSYHCWFKRVISVFIELFFILSIIATLYVFGVPFGDKTRIVFVAIASAYGAFVFCFKKSIKKILDKTVARLSKLDTKSMLAIIVIVMIVLKIIYTRFFFFDPTKGGDVSIYNGLANSIISGEHISSKTISHLLGIAFHLAFFKVINIPLHIGMFILFLIGTIVNFYSFKEIVGKEKSFLAVMFYIAMPSTIMLTFIPTHEVLSYLYFSLFLFAFNKFIKLNNKKDTVLFAAVTSIVVFLTNSSSPIGSVMYAILGISALLSKIATKKRAVIICSLILSIVASSLVSSSLEKRYGIDKLNSTMNTYYILIHGSNIESLGEQVDDYPNKAVREYLRSHNLEASYNYENATKAGKAVVIQQYKYLFTHPADMFRLLAHKFFILWSGDHYSMEMAQEYDGINSLQFYVMLGFSTIIYLFCLTIAIVYNRHEDDDMYISNAKLILLGTVGITFISVLLNKYGVPVTIFIYLIAFYRAKLGDTDV